ncbi:hypothetical protein AB6A40_009415 [Gnathostoma spinigerum]|uniref:Uncharacterized protein n=1 Tax=Gnathostoma spinigerum TaxID=75299 RepID=A0ABD6EZ12_9BILA
MTGQDYCGGKTTATTKRTTGTNSSNVSASQFGDRTNELGRTNLNSEGDIYALTIYIVCKYMITGEG